MSAANALLGLLAVFVLTAGTGYFVAQEFAYVSADRLALARQAEAGDRKAAAALKVLERLSFMCRVTPRDELASVPGREQLTHFVEESKRLGLISETDSELLTRSLTEPETPVRDLRVPAARITSVEGAAGIDEILCAAADSDRTRLLVLEGDAVLGSVHARDALVTRAQGRTTNARGLARPVPELGEETTVADAIDVLRRHRSSLAVVRDETGRLTGMVTLDDLLSRFLQPQSA